MAKNTLKMLTAAQLAVIYNEVSERKVSRFSDQSTALKRTEAALEAAGKVATIQNAGDPFQYTIADKGSAPASGRDGDEREITVLAETNPKAKGSKSHARFELYAKSRTVADYIAAASRLGGGRRKAMRDIAWDTDHGYIKLD